MLEKLSYFVIIPGKQRKTENILNIKMNLGRKIMALFLIKIFVKHEKIVHRGLLAIKENYEENKTSRSQSFERRLFLLVQITLDFFL